MLSDCYEVKISDDFLSYRFTSIGPKGLINKSVLFSETEIEGLYNLGFGDLIEETNNVDDLAVTNNGDTNKILRTVASSLLVFLNEYPYANVIATGSTASRTRLYQIAISKNFRFISNDFEILGLKDNDWEEYNINTNYLAFLIRKK